MIRAIVKLITALNSNAKKSQVAAGFAWGMLLGLVPAGNFFWIVLFLISFFFSHNNGSKNFFMALIKLLSFIITGENGPIDNLGYWFLNLDAFNQLFTTMYNMPFVPFTKFNNTLVMGGLVAGIVLWLPVFIITMILVPLYRNHLGPKIRDSKIMKFIYKLPFLRVIDKVIS